MPELYTGDRARTLASNAVWLHLLPLPLIFAALGSLAGGRLGELALEVCGFVGLMAGAILVRQGLVRERDYNRRTVARAPRLPRKLLGAALYGVSTGAVVLATGMGLSVAAVAASGAALGVAFVYGLDPRRDKAVQGAGGVTTAEVEETVRTALAKIAGIDAAARQIGNMELRARLGRIASRARDIVGVLESDPKDIRRARKFLHVYLDGARDVAAKYAATHARVESGELEENFRRVLEGMEKTFEAQHMRLLADDVNDLDVDLEVLRLRLKEEGVV
ncbi:5-bromo-4-chloroindolyl phosphate hydrolysis family protein [Futiania mangrovi]|uniref:5-bromo-4-chloroindolyl phosphate hydrolysis family protein n=1 Tax=Futiania mangrovi TaxID=2959716 RepID=A0A9J6PEF0_9PROT|nr:5-bromo-4-chloroindolyl phosphate hydrolysis family protein [Futiania mangrovii]MCP1334999.1 5-bromo-4-chloroindolyl phosphate hydrolysis family protein [Futiania mangrovii]